MPGASLVAAVVSPDVLEALPGDKEVFFGMLHLECGTSCTKTDGIWLLQGQWPQVKDAVTLLDIIERSKNSNEALVDRVFFDEPSESNNNCVNTGVGSKKVGRFQQKFVVEWSGFFNEIQKEFSSVVVEKFKRIVTAAVRKEEEVRQHSQNNVEATNTRRPLTRRKGLPHRLKSTSVENPLATALAIAFESNRSMAAGHANGQNGESDNEDAASIDSVDSVDIQQALEEHADIEYTTKRRGTGKGKVKRGKKSAEKDAGFRQIVRRDGKSKVARIGKRSADALNKILRNLTAEPPPVCAGNTSLITSTVDLQRSSNDLVFSTSDMVFPSRSEDDPQHSTTDELVDLTEELGEGESQEQQPLVPPLTTPIYRCPICSTFTSESRGGIKIHAFSAHLAASYRCFVCKGVFSSKLALERHRVSHRHETFPFLKCLCSRILTSRSGLTRHIATCQSLIIGAQLIDDPNAADSLEENVTPYITFDANGQPKKAPGRRPRPEQFVCDICRTFSAPSGPKLVHHKLTQHPEEALKCSTCPSLTFNNFAEFHQHNSLHVTKLPCEHCGKIFSNARSYEAHQRIHESGNGKSAFVCTICARAFTTAYVLKYHMQYSHLELGKRFHCSRCGRSFSQKIHLIEHLYSHDGLKPYMCDVCGRGFSHQTSLQQHKLTHGEETRYKCEDCPKSFRTRASLLMHRNCHTERKHQCQYCGKLFTQKTARIRHERIHTGEQPYKCTSCSKAFSDSSVLRRHMLTHDPNHAAKRSPVSAKKSGEMAGVNPLAASAMANQAAEASSVVDLTSLVSTSQNATVQKVARTRAPRANRNTNSNRNKKIAPNFSNNLPLMQFGGNSAFCQPQPSIDSALDLHLFSPMSVLVQQPTSSMNMHQSVQQHQALITSETCPSPETPPPISVPDLQNVVDDSRLFHQPQNLVFNSQRAHENATTSNSGHQQQQQYHVIQLPSEAVQIVQMAGPSNLSSRNSGNNMSKFSSYMQQQQQQRDSRPPSNSSVVESSALLQGAMQCSAPVVGSNNHHSQQQQQVLYSMGSQESNQSTVVDLIGSQGQVSSNSIQQFFLSSDASGSGATLFAVPAEAFFSLQSQQQPGAESPPPPQPQHQPPSCSYQFSDLQLSLVDNHHQQQQQQQQQQRQQNSISDQSIIYQSVPAAFLANMDGTAIPVSVFSEQFGGGGMGPNSGNGSGRHLVHINPHQLMGTGGNEMQQNNSVQIQPLLQMPPPLTRPQNAHQRVNNPQYH